MKKFTHLDEDLIKENQEADKKYLFGYSSAVSKLEAIKSSLTNMSNEQSNDPGNYGYVGDINNVNDKLDEILDFLIKYQNTYSEI